MDIQLSFLHLNDVVDKEANLLIVLPTGEAEGSAHMEDCRELAFQSGKAVVTASYRRENRLSMAFLSPDLTVVQDACFFAEKNKWTFIAGQDVAVFETPFGRMALCCGMDGLQPQYARLAALRGCQLMVTSMWNNENSLFLTGPWSAAQANGMAIAVGGKTGGKLILPSVCTPDNSGLGRTRFALAELESAYDQFPLFDGLNSAFYQKHQEALSC